MSEIVDRIVKGKENDYTPVNQYIDEQSRLRRARSFWIRAKSWALILIAIGFLMVLLAWAYSLLHKHYILKRVGAVQERVIQEQVNSAIGAGEFSKSADNLSKLKDSGIPALEEKEKMEEKLAEENEKNEKLKLENKDLNDQLKDLRAQINSQEFLQEDLMKQMEESHGDKIKKLESEKLNLLNETADLKEKLKSQPDSSELIKKIDELEKKGGKGLGDLRYFTAKRVDNNNHSLTVKTRFHFEDVRKKPNKIECYINFGNPALADLELQTQKFDFNVSKPHLDAGFKKSELQSIKNKHCSWNYFN